MTRRRRRRPPLGITSAQHLVDHRELELLRACAGRDRHRIAVRAHKLSQAVRRLSREQRP